MSRTFSTKFGSLEGLKVSTRCGLQAVLAPDAVDGGWRQAARLGHRAQRPVRRRGRVLVPRALHHRGDPLGRGGGEGAAAWGVPEKAVGAILHVARLPAPDRGLPVPAAARIAVVPAPSATTPSSRSPSPGRSRTSTPSPMRTDSQSQATVEIVNVDQSSGACCVRVRSRRRSRLCRSRDPAFPAVPPQRIPLSNPPGNTCRPSGPSGSGTARRTAASGRGP